jgi:hypothetical protein
MRRLILGATIAALTAWPALAAGMLKGSFGGENGHLTRGSVEVLEVDGKWIVRLGADFEHDGTAPDATVALGKDGYDAATNMGPLIANEGTQDYVLPEGIDPTGYNEVYIWCREFSVSLGAAKVAQAD